MLENKPKIALTQFAHGAGCGCKIAPQILSQILSGQTNNEGYKNLLVGNSHNDDAAVYDLGNGQAMIATADFFTPIVDEPYDFGRIAAANRRGPDVQFIHVPLSTRLHALGASNENGSIDNLKKATVSLAVALALAGGPLSVAVTPDVAFAAPAATSTSAVIPEQQAIADAQASADAASKRLDATRKELNTVQAAFKSAEASYTKANQEATRAKAAFLSANDALSAAKSSKSKDASRIAALTTKVGTYNCDLSIVPCSIFLAAHSWSFLNHPTPSLSKRTPKLVSRRQLVRNKRLAKPTKRHLRT